MIFMQVTDDPYDVSPCRGLRATGATGARIVVQRIIRQAHDTVVRQAHDAVIRQAHDAVIRQAHDAVIRQAHEVAGRLSQFVKRLVGFVNASHPRFQATLRRLGEKQTLKLSVGLAGANHLLP